MPDEKWGDGGASNVDPPTVDEAYADTNGISNDEPVDEEQKPRRIRKKDIEQ